MRSPLLRSAVAAAACAVAALVPHIGQAAITFDGNPYLETFDALPNTPESASSGNNQSIIWANDSTLAGWSLFRRPATAPIALATILASTGSNNTGSFYSFGSSGDADRALGGIGSGGAYYGSPSTGAVAGWMAVTIVNGTASTINAVQVEYDGEQWRNGGNDSAQTMTLEYGFGTAFVDVAEWIAPGGNFDFTSPVTGSAATLNGNDPSNRIEGLGGEISGINWASGDTLWIRWIENNDAGNDHGLAVDNFKFSAGSIEPPTNNADFNDDSFVDGQDFLIWQRGVGLENQLDKSTGDADGDGFVNGVDLGIWMDRFGGAPATTATHAVPEPASFCLAAFAAAVGLWTSRRR